MNKTILAALSTIIFSLAAENAMAWDKEVQGKIAILAVATAGGSYITLVGGKPLCNSSTEPRFGRVYYPPVTDSVGATLEGRRAVIATLMAAKLAGKRVTVFANNNPGDWGCIIGAIQVEE